MKASDTPTAAGTSLASFVAQAAQQQAQVIGVRTLLEFVAWLVCSSGPGSAANAPKGKQAAQPGTSSRRGTLFLTEELSDVGIAVRRMQVSSSHACSMLPRKQASDCSTLCTHMDPHTSYTLSQSQPKAGSRQIVLESRSQLQTSYMPESVTCVVMKRASRHVQLCCHMHHSIRYGMCAGRHDRGNEDNGQWHVSSRNGAQSCE